MLRQIEMLKSQGKAAPAACREAEIAQQALGDGCLNREISTVCRRLLSPLSNGHAWYKISVRPLELPPKHPKLVDITNVLRHLIQATKIIDRL